MTFLSKLADRLILQPTTDPIDPEQRERIWITTPGGNKVEAWRLRTQAETDSSDNKVVLIKFPGTGGRAERSGPFPANLWHNTSADIWTVNHRGWGQSEAPATMKNFMETCDSVWDHARQVFPDRKIIVYGNSLGCISALYLSARHDVSGAYLRNPPPLANLISTMPKYAWPSLGLSRLIANQVPRELDAIENAKLSKCPALFVSSQMDQVVPIRYQDSLFNAYAGPKKRFIIEGADHHHSIPDSQEEEYRLACQWLENQALEKPSN